MHLDDQLLQRLADREDSGVEDREARRHVEACVQCRARLEETRARAEDVRRILHALDHPLPPIDAATFMARVQAGFPRRPGRLRWAAGVVLALGVAGAAYAAPGSPVPDWLRTLRSRLDGSAPAERQEVPGDRDLSGVSVAAGEEVNVIFRSVGEESSIQVSLSDGPDVVVRAPEGQATFTTGEDTLVVVARVRLAHFRVEIPRTAPSARILVNGTLVFVKEGGSIALEGGEGGTSTGPWLLSPVGSR